MPSQNPLQVDDPRYASDPDNPLTAGSPTPADAYSYNATTLGNWLAQQRAKSAQMGLWNDQTGMPTAAGILSAGQQYGNALLAGTSGPKEPSLLPAWRIAGQVFSSPDAETHQAAWNLIPEAYRTAAVNNASSIQKVFVNENGKVLDRRQAFEYAMDNGMLHPAFVRAFKNAAGDVNPNAELTAEMLQ